MVLHAIYYTGIYARKQAFGDRIRAGDRDRESAPAMDGAATLAYYRRMIGFLLKKHFYDVWDNMLRIVLVNLGFLVSLLIPGFLFGLISISPLFIPVFALGILWCFVYLAAAALSLKSVSDYGSFGFGDFLANVKAGLKAGVTLGLTVILLVLMPLVIIPFYWRMGNLLGFLLAAVIFWTFLLTSISLQFFLAVRARLDTKTKKIFKKCFIIFFDNQGFAIFSLLHSILLIALSVITAGLFPGPAGVLLFLDEGLRLRLLKYDWLDANPPTEPTRRRRRIPWDAILIDEREKTGTRTLKNLVFPWKD